ncbi:alpha/beta hydrolase, partial [Rhodococcus hoagii]|nr:alpha/beta hydrolase [Prescottella equi]
AEAFGRTCPMRASYLMDGGHFLLELHLDDVVRVIDEWRSETFDSMARR